jgi:hypothetical protein
MNLTRTVSSLIGGAASANYITPIVVNVTSLDNTHYHYGIAFLLGFLGLKGIEYFSRKLIPESAHEELLITPAKPIKKRRITKRKANDTRNTNKRNS